MMSNNKFQSAALTGDLQPSVRTSFYNTYVDYETYIPLEYWKQGADEIPDEAFYRIKQLETYDRLYQGEIDGYFQSPLVVKMNYWYMVAERMNNFLMQYPPEFNFDWADMVSDRFIQQLNKQLPNVIIDLVRFGTGLFNVVNTEKGAEVQTVVPIYWYPVDDVADVLVVMPNDKDIPYTLYVHFMNGEVEIREYENDAGKLGKRIRGTVSERFGNAATWSALEDVSIDRVGPIIPVSIEPSAGDWGRSSYFDITSLALELNRRLSGNSEILTDHGNPRLKVLPDALQPAVRPENIERELLKTVTEQTRLDTLRKTTTMLIPRGYSDIEYLFWQGTLDDHFMQFDKTQEQMFSLTHLPLALMSIEGRVSVPASGRALRFQYMDPHAHIQKIQAQIINKLKQTILTGAIYNGAGASAVTQFADRIDIKWKNVFDEIDESGVVELDEGDDAEVIDDGDMDIPFQDEEAV